MAAHLRPTRVEQAFARDGVQPEIVFRAAANEAVLSMVKAGIGSAILPRLVLQGANVASDQALSIHELRPPFPPREIYLLWHAGRTHSPLAARAIEIAVDVAATYQPQDQTRQGRVQTRSRATASGQT